MKHQGTYGRHATRSFAWNHFYKLSEFGLLNVYTMIVARYFGPVGSTPFVVYAAAGTILSLMAAFAVDGALLRYLPRISERPESAHELGVSGVVDTRSLVRKLFAFRIFMVLCVACLIILSALFFTDTFGQSDTVDSIRSLAPLLCVFLLAQSVIAFSSFALIGLLRTKAVFISSVIARSLLVVAAIILIEVVGDFSIRNAILLHISSALLNAALLLLGIKRLLDQIDTGKRISLGESLRSIASDVFGFIRRPSSVKTLLLSPLMLFGLTLWGNDVLNIALGRQSDILLIRILFGDQTPEVGYYNVASLVLLLTEYIFLLGFGGALVSVFSKLAHDDETSSKTGKIEYPRLSKGRSEVAGFQIVTLMPLCVFMFTFPLTVVKAIYGSEYDAAAPLVQYGIIALAVNTGIFSGGLQITTLITIGKERFIFKNRLFWGISCVVANYFLIKSYGAAGAIVGTNWANTLACASEWYVARKHVGGGTNLVSLLWVTGIAAAVALGVYEGMRFIDMRQGPILELMVAGTVFFLVVAGLFYMFRIPETAVLISRLRKAFAS